LKRRAFLKSAPAGIVGSALHCQGLSPVYEVLVQPPAAADVAPRNPQADLAQAVEGAARFTVLTPDCIRMEYAPKYGFVDAPSLFAIRRDCLYAKAKISRTAGILTIDTGKLQLQYKPDGKPFSKENLQVSFGPNSTIWHPEKKNQRNLGGPVPTLDGIGDPFPLPDGLLSRDGWYLLDDSGRPLLVDGWITQRIGGGPRAPGMPSGINPDKDWYLFTYGTDYKSALRALSAISGPVPMPRKGVHGSWYCRWYPYTADQFRQIVKGYKDHNFPLDILVMDMEWHTKNADVGFGHAGELGWTGYTWNRKLIPDPTALLQEFRNDGVFVTLNDHPHDGVRDNEQCYPEFMKMAGGKPGTNLPLDAGNRRYMEAFFAAAHTPLEKQGVDFWWVDWQQDSLLPWVHGVPGLRHLPWLNYLYFQHSQNSGLRGQGFSRWGGWGDHRNPIQFSGDTTASWAMLAFEIYFTLASGNAGCFFWAHDLGAFEATFGTPADSELYTRWVQFGALSSSLRLHSDTDIDRRPWLWGKQFEDAMRQAYVLRSQLFPYIYTAVRQCYDQTLPLLRPMYLEYPQEKNSYQYPEQYLLGDHLIAAPITESGEGEAFVAQKKIWLPAGIWYNLTKAEKFQGDQVVTASAALNEIPVYARGGVPLPMQPSTLRMTSTPLTTLVVRCYPGIAGESSLYEDDGRTQGYMQDQFSRTSLSYRNERGHIQIKIAAATGMYQGQPVRRSYRIELPWTQRAKSAFVNGRRTPVSYDPAGKTNILETDLFEISEAVEVTVHADEWA
jgi:hypothetical protein